MLVVEHNIQSLLQHVDRAYLLDKGQVVHVGAPDEIRDSDILEKVFLGEYNAQGA